MYCLQYEDEEEEEEDAAGQAARLKERQRLEQDDQMFPDEVRAVHAVLTLCSCCAHAVLAPACQRLLQPGASAGIKCGVSFCCGVLGGVARSTSGRRMLPQTLRPAPLSPLALLLALPCPVPPSPACRRWTPRGMCPPASDSTSSGG